jgi:hypothetical protein
MCTTDAPAWVVCDLRAQARPAALENLRALGDVEFWRVHDVTQHARLRAGTKECPPRSCADRAPPEFYAAITDVAIFAVLFEHNRDAESLLYRLARKPVRTGCEASRTASPRGARRRHRITRQASWFFVVTGALNEHSMPWLPLKSLYSIMGPAGASGGGFLRNKHREQGFVSGPASAPATYAH